MQTVPQPSTATQLHRRHGADRAILGLSRSGCTSPAQRQGFDEMAARMEGFRLSCEQGPVGDDLDQFAASLQARYEQAQARRAWALALAAEAEAIEAEMDSPFYVDSGVFADAEVL